RGTRRATSRHQRGEESDGGSPSRRKLRLSGVRFPSGAQSEGRMACSLHAKAQEADGAATEAQGHVSSPPITTCWSRREVDQPGVTWMGELLRGRTFQRVLQLRERLGGKEGSALGIVRASIGSGGVGNGCTTNCASSRAIALYDPRRKRLQQDRSHKP